AKPVLLFIAKPVEEQLGQFYRDRVNAIDKSLKEQTLSQELAHTNEPREVDLSFQKGQLYQALGLPEPQPATQASDWVSVRAWVRPLELAIALSESQLKIGRR